MKQKNRKLKFKIENFEKILDKSVKRDIISLGVDTATRTGWSRIRIDSATNSVELDYGVINVATKEKHYVYDQIIDLFKDLIDSILHPRFSSTVIIEDTFLRFNVNVLKLLSRLGMIIYVIAKLKSVDKKKFIGPAQARKTLNLKGTAKKSVVHAEFREKYPKLIVEDADVIDAIVLALNGVIND